MAWITRRGLRTALWSSGLMATAGVIAWGVVAPRLATPRPTYLDLPRAAVARADLQATVVAGGVIDTAQKTVVECDLSASLSPTSPMGGFSTILELVPDGSLVKKGQMLARIDASDYEEQFRQHEILLMQARTDEEKARLDVKTAEIALAEYRDGQLPQIRESYQGQILLGESDIRRAKDRLEWVDRMVTSGYVSQGQRLNERAALEKAEVNLVKVRGELATIDNQTAALEILKLKQAVEKNQGELDYQALRLANVEAQHQKLRKQVDACTIRAPHDGMVIYATNYNPNVRVETGATVYNRMNLFYLPDLTQAEVKVDAHESSIRNVRVGQSVRVRVMGLSGRVLEGHVKTVGQLAMESKHWWMSRDIRSVQVVVGIHSVPPGVLPGMNAEVAIGCEPHQAALAIPSTAVVNDRGREVVYVVRRGGLERRAVETESGDTRRLEILSGLAEGEEVILDPGRIDPADIKAAQVSQVVEDEEPAMLDDEEPRGEPAE